MLETGARATATCEHWGKQRDRQPATRSANRLHDASPCEPAQPPVFPAPFRRRDRPNFRSIPMSAPANFNGQAPFIDPNDTA
ncbi:hypothetical protein, partial [Burkholderia multivorans]|uniref:hypothetical protein n=1 Tax=Burkholderia multivorans TaxID=87883 RepID=UPI0011B1EBE5